MKVNGDKNRCYWCNTHLNHDCPALDPFGGPPLNRATKDHVVPKAKGGNWLVWCCWACNNLKGDIDPKTWTALILKFHAEGFHDWRELARKRGPRGEELAEAAFDVGFLPSLTEARTPATRKR